jgi:tetratricopeptide (TPR) repeat protein
MNQKQSWSRSAWRALGALLVLGLVTAHAAAQEPPGDAKAALSAAAKIQQEARGKRGEERTAILERAVAAFDQAAKEFAADKVASQEALYRGAGILRGLGRNEDARLRYERAVELNAVRANTARSMLELGHLARRRSDVAGAKEWYERVAKEFAALLPYRDDALLWIGKLLRDQGNHAGARERWQPVAEGGESASDRIQAFDLIARSWLVQGDAKQAAAVIAACDEAFREQAAEDSAEGRRITGALERMRSRAELEKSGSGEEGSDGDGEGETPTPKKKGSGGRGPR